MPSVDQFVVWVVVGLIGGSLAGLIVTQHRQGLGFVRNLGVGLAGALWGGALFRVLGLLPQLDKVMISLRDVVARHRRIAAGPLGALVLATLA